MHSREPTNESTSSASFLFPWILPRLDSETVLAKNAIASRFPGAFGRLRLPSLAKLLGGDDAVLELRAIERGYRPPERPTLVLALSTGPSPRSKRVALGLPIDASRRIVDRISRRESKGKRDVSNPTTGELGILMYALDRAAGDWIEAGGAKFYVRGGLHDFGQIPEYLGSAPWFVVSARFVESGLNFPIHLWLPSTTLERRSDRRIPSATGRWPVTVRVQIGAARIAAPELEDLGAGDLMVCDEIGHPLHESTPSRCTLRCGAWRKDATWRGLSTLIIDEPDKGQPMEDKSFTELKTTLNPPLKPSHGDLEVEVSVEIGRLRLRVDEASALMAGTVLKLDRDIGSEVSLVIGDRAIASGRLVAHEDRLAVELTEVTT